VRDALDLYDLPFYNNSGEAIPPYAVMQVDNWKDDANNRDYFRVRKPNGSGKMFIVNGPLEVAIAGDGMGSRKEGIPARYLSGTPAPDEEWGPTSGSWYLSASGSGFNVVGGNETLNGATVTHVNLAGASSGNIIYAQVNKVTNVGTGEPNFPFDNAQPVVGAAPSGGTGTAQNQYAQEYLNDEWVFLFENKLTGQWLTERGGTSGSQVVYFEITEHKVYGDNAVLAKPVLADGTMDSGADAFYVVDEKNLFYGRAAESSEDGYRGFALRYTDDYSEGVPGFRIIEMEGPADFLVIELAQDLAGPSAECNLSTAPNTFGLAFNGRTPPPEVEYDLDVWDDLSVAEGAKDGEKWIAKWADQEEHYVFWRKLSPSVAGDRQYGLLIADVPPATPVYDATRSYITHGFAENAVIPLEKVTEGGSDGGDQLQAELDGEDEQIVRDCVNPIWSTQIKAGTTTNADKPVIVRGFQDVWNIYTGGSVVERTVFVLSAIFYPVTIMKGLSQGAVTGSAFTVDNLTLLWGREPGVSSIASVANPDSWEADDNSYCLIMQLTDGTWQAIDLACPEA
jgi:hypothetical protein